MRDHMPRRAIAASAALSLLGAITALAVVTRRREPTADPEPATEMAST